MRTGVLVVTDWMAARATDRAARASWPVTVERGRAVAMVKSASSAV